MAKFIKETYKKENGELVKYPLGADIKNVVITKVNEDGSEVIKNTLDKELEIIKQDSSSAAYPSYSIENIEEEGLEKLTKGESISASIRKLYKVTSRFINHLKNITSGENHIPIGGKEGDILLWDSDGQAKWGPDENTTYSNFQGATANDAGKAGLVLAPAAGEQNKFLKGDGTWGSPDNAQYTSGIGISILNNQIGLATATITNTNGTDTSGTEITLPYLTFDEYGRVKNIGTKKHTLPNSTFVGGTLTETLYYGSDKNYSTNTSGISTLSKIMLKVDSGYTGIDLTSGTDNYNIGIEDNILQFKKDETTAYQIDTDGNNIFDTNVSVTGLKSTDGADKVIIAEAGTGKLKTSSSITATELGYLDGVTSNIQTQLNAKVNKTGDTMTGALKFGSDSYYISSLGNATLKSVNANNINSKGYSRIDITSQTLDLNDFNLSSGSPHIEHYRCRTSGGAANISNIPVTGHPFILDVESIRWASTTDYISRQVFISIGDKQNEYIRYCTNGTWEANWTKRVFTDTKYSVATTSANGLMSSADKTKLNGIGTIVSTTPSAVSMKGQSGGTGTAIASVKFPVGVYVVTCAAHFPAYSSSAGSYRRATLSTTSGLIDASRGISMIAAPIKNQTTMVQMNTILNVTTAATYYLNAQHNSSESLEVSGQIRAVKIE